MKSLPSRSRDILEELERYDANFDKPGSVSLKVWPILREMGEERKTRVFSEQSSFDGREADCLASSSAIVVFNRVSDRIRNGVFTAEDGAIPHMRTRMPLGWFDLNNPGIVYFSSDGMIPLQGNLVFMSRHQVNNAYEIAERSMGEAGAGRESAFAAETHLIRKAELLASRGHAPASTFKALAVTAHVMNMPRLKAFAQDEIDIQQVMGQQRLAVALTRLSHG